METVNDLNSFKLTSTELTVARLLLTDKNYNDIGDDLFISNSTARKHASNIYKKCNVSSINEFKSKFILS